MSPERLAETAGISTADAGALRRAALGHLPSCDKCRSLDVATAACGTCGKVYARCPACGGTAGCLRSVHSHAALFHPKNRSR